MNTQAYLVVVMSFVFMITNVLGAAFSISRLRSKTTRVAGIVPIGREPTNASHGPLPPNQESNPTGAILVSFGRLRFRVVAEGMAVIIGSGLVLFAVLKILGKEFL
jgi:hypothetical protein